MIRRLVPATDHLVGHPRGFVCVNDLAAAEATCAGTEWNEIADPNDDRTTAAPGQSSRSFSHLRWLNEQENLTLGIAAHELRNPIGAILSYTELVMEDGGTLLPEQRSMIEKIRTNATFMLNMVDDLLDLSAIESGTVNLTPSPFHLDDAVNDALIVCGAKAANKNIRLISELSRTPLINADREKIAQVLQNLVFNAIKFSPPGMAISIVTSMAGRDEVAFEVRDHGQGMSEHDQAKLFRPFSKLSVRPTAGEKSTGLGLVIVKRLVEAHGGSIRATSAVGLGTTFRVVLPMSAQPRTTAQ